MIPVLIHERYQPNFKRNHSNVVVSIFAVQFTKVSHKKGESRQVAPKGHGLKYLIIQEGDGKPATHQSADTDDTESDGWSTEEEEMHCGEANRHVKDRVKKKATPTPTPPAPPASGAPPAGAPPAGDPTGPQPHSSHQDPPDTGGAAGDGTGDQGGGGDDDTVSLKKDTVQQVLSATRRLTRGLKRLHEETGITPPPAKAGKFVIPPVERGQKVTSLTLFERNQAKSVRNLVNWTEF